ncbi:hypothetical protein C8T65DRAFT_684068 [Cerioporus squamosus]|nr:hypothetical protein C8T65DRAFT_684068 [Cerioporus squamosus]
MRQRLVLVDDHHLRKVTMRTIQAPANFAVHCGYACSIPETYLLSLRARRIPTKTAHKPPTETTDETTDENTDSDGSTDSDSDDSETTDSDSDWTTDENESTDESTDESTTETTADTFPMHSTFKVVRVLRKHEFVRTNMELYSVTLLVTSVQSDIQPPQSLNAICKITRTNGGRKDLFEEAKILENALKKLQGDVVPEFFGYFQEPQTSGGDRMALLLLQDVGPQLHRPLRCLPTDFSIEVMEALYEVHQAGVLLRNFRESSIFVLKHEDGFFPFIYNFDTALVHHDCKMSVPLVPRLAEPRHVDIGCAELYDTMYRADIWTPAIKLFKDSVTFSAMADDIQGPESLVEFHKTFASEQPEHADADVMRAAEVAYATFKEWRDERDRKDQQAFAVELQPGERWLEMDKTTW